MPDIVRRLDMRSRKAVLAHLLALPADDRYCRFGSSLRDAGIQNYVARIDFERDLLLGIESAQGLEGLAHVSWGGGTLAELGLSVAATSRLRGFARALFASAARCAISAGRAGFECIHGHPATVRIAFSLGFAVERRRGDPNVALHVRFFAGHRPRASASD